MEFKQGAAIEASEGEKIGSLERIVIHPKTKTVSHLVVRKGTLLPEEKVIPVDLVETADENYIHLRPFAGTVDDFPNFEDTQFVMTDEDEALRTGIDREQRTNVYRAPLLYWYPPVVGGAGLIAPGTAAAPYLIPDTGTLNYEAEVHQNIPEGAVALQEGAKVYSSDDKEVGSVERVFTSAEGDQVSHILFSKGLLFKEHKLIPVHWIDHVAENRIKLAVSARYLETLKDYED